MGEKGKEHTELFSVSPSEWRNLWFSVTDFFLVKLEIRKSSRRWEEKKRWIDLRRRRGQNLDPMERKGNHKGRAGHLRANERRFIWFLQWAQDYTESWEEMGNNRGVVGVAGRGGREARGSPPHCKGTLPTAYSPNDHSGGIRSTEVSE